MKHSIRSIVFAPLLLLWTGTYASLADPITTEQGAYDLRFFVATSVTLRPGEIGFVTAALQNTGTLPIVFQEWDASLSTGGYGWNFDAPGFTIGNVGHLSNTGTPIISAGHANSRQIDPQPDFSALDQRIIAPGETLVFDLWSVLMRPGVESATDYTASQFSFGDPVFAGWNSAFYVLNLTLGDEYSVGPLQEVQLSRWPADPASPVPEPSTPPSTDLPPRLVMRLGAGEEDALCLDLRWLTSSESGIRCQPRRTDRHDGRAQASTESD